MTTRLHTEWARLYGVGPSAMDLIDDQGAVRALVLQLSGPPEWSRVSHLWQGVQAELQLPAPAIAVNGVDGFQLWFSLAQAAPAAQAHACLQGLWQRYWADVPASRIGMWPRPDGRVPSGHGHGHSHIGVRVPACQRQQDVWSAFVAPDLAPVFADAPWLDIPPNDDGQADLLAQLGSISPATWQQALACHEPTVAPAEPALGASATLTSASTMGPRQFLLSVINDPKVELALRIEAARTLLPHMAEPMGKAEP